MSGILEAIHAELQAINAKLSAGAAPQAAAPAPAATVAAQPIQQPAVQQPTPAVDPFAAAPPVTNGAGTVSEAQVMALIEPHLDNLALKTALSGVLGQMGIARLPEARPDQLPALYQAFQGIIAQHAAAPAAGAPIGII